ncbi:MAG TPA: MlaD family protein [Candidatus Solibacter sp.]|nr:MlaD family protein [Candidatus Solibacter sp.]
MDSKKEQAFVGIFVVIASALLIATIFAIGGAFGGSQKTFFVHFKNAGGLEPGSIVRYAGIRVGRVEKVSIDPKDAASVVMQIGVDPDIPVKADSLTKVASLSALGENYLEIMPGKAETALAKSGTVLPSKEFFGIGDVADILNDLGPKATDLVTNLNSRVVELKTTIERVNDLINDQNRANVSSSLGNLNGMLAENRPHIKSALGHVDEASAKIGPTVDQFKETAKQADETLKKIDDILGENRGDLKASIAQLRKALDDATKLVDQLNRTLNTNSENIDETLDNVRLATENLRQFTDTIRTRPYTLIRSSQPPEHKPGEGSKP